MDMEVEKRIQFLLENQSRFDARMEANFARAEERFSKFEDRFARAEKRMDRVERVVAQLSVAGLRFAMRFGGLNLRPSCRSKLWLSARLKLRTS